MALVTELYYNQTYLGEQVATEEFPRYEARAEDAVLALVSLSPEAVMELPNDKQNAVLAAICAQIEYLNEFGISVATYGKVAAGFTVGKVSVNSSGNGGKADTQTGAKSMICPAVYFYLEKTGLLNPAVYVSGEPWSDVWGWF